MNLYHSKKGRNGPPVSLVPQTGICQWFHYQDDEAVLQTAALLKEAGVRHLRTGVSWADYHRPGGRDWYAWLLEELSFCELLINVWHTPPSISENGQCNGPPRDLDALAGFVWELDHYFGEKWQTLEIWNEPNNRMKWDFQACDPNWHKFAHMVNLAAAEAHRRGKRTVLGGMIPVDPAWLALMDHHGGLEHIDIVAIHGFPQMWWHGPICWEWQRDWHGWEEKVEKIKHIAGKRPVWITETGLATWEMASGRRGRHQLQSAMLRQACDAPAARVYWYSMIDLNPRRSAIEGFHVDENEYHLGLVTCDGLRKPAFHTFKDILSRSSQVMPSHATDSKVFSKYTLGGVGL